LSLRKEKQSHDGPGEKKKKLANTFFPTVMERDRRLTGYLRGQTDRVDAPAGFEVSNPWKVSHRLTYTSLPKASAVFGEHIH